MKYLPKIVFFELCCQSIRETPWSSSPVLGMESVRRPHGSVEVGTNCSTFKACWLKRVVGTRFPVKVFLPVGSAGSLSVRALLRQVVDSSVLKSPLSAAWVGAATCVGACN